ncbi:MAG TPA: PIN domain-containing protein [Terriglobales bacterium]|nr:PIN domain-containing protein [Terriglobales bacterium]
MISIQDSECVAVLDACVLVPMALCDTLLRLAEEPAMYRPVWSAQIMQELAKALKTKLRRSTTQIEYRLKQMNAAFPQTMVKIPNALIKASECIPDKNDRHILAAAIVAHADVIVTQNTKHFPAKCLDEYNVITMTADDFLLDRYYLNHQTVVDKLDDQAAAIAKDRAFIISSLKLVAPKFAKQLQEPSL